MRPFLILAVLLFVLPSGTRAQEFEDLQFLIMEALTRNPEIAAELARMKSAESRISQEGSLDDPELTFKRMEFPGLDFGAAMYSNIELMQMIPFPTKLFLRSSIAEIRAEHAHHEHLEKVVSVIADLKTTYAMLWYARTALSINRDNQTLLGQIVRAAETQYAVGRVSQQDVLKARIELARTQSEEASLRQAVVGSESMLRAILNRRPDERIGELTMDTLFVPPFSVDDLVQYALMNRPMIVHDSLSIREADLMVRMAKQEYIPDFRISFEYVRMPQEGLKRWSVMAGLTIPFAPWTLGKASGRVEEAQAMESMKRSMFQASKNMVESRVRNAYAKVEAAAVLSRAYEREILPQSRQSLFSLMTEYQTGKTSYLMLIDAYRMYQMARMDAAMARMNYEQAIALLEREVGVIDLTIVPTKSKE